MQISNNGWDAEFSGRTVGQIYPALAACLEKFLGELPSGSKIIDLGCGDGKYSFLMADKGFHVLGTDSSVTAISVASEHLRNYPRPGLRFRKAKMQDRLEMEEGFDGAVLINSYHCLKNADRKHAIAGVNRLLVPGGNLFLTALSLEDESYPRSKWNEIEPNTFSDEAGCTFHFFSDRELRSELAAFDVAQVSVLSSLKQDVGRTSSLFILEARKRG